MDIRFITQNDTDFRQVVGMINDHLPKIQTLPHFVIRLLLLNPDSHLLGLYEKERLIGAAFISESSEMIYVMYLVILPEYRRCHYASTYFTRMKEYAKERSIVWNVWKNNPNVYFFKNISGTDTGYVRTILGHEYTIYCLNGFDPSEYKKLAKSIYFGFNQVTIKKKV